MNNPKPQHHYTKDNLTVYWEPKKCIHSGICARGLPEVFKPKERPWVQPEAASTKEIAAQIDLCPSSALSYEWAGGSEEKENTTQEFDINITPDGPILINGPLRIDYKGETTNIPAGKKVALCRCGASKNKPMCDGSHKTTGFSD